MWTLNDFRGERREEYMAMASYISVTTIVSYFLLIAAMRSPSLLLSHPTTTLATIACKHHTNNNPLN